MLLCILAVVLGLSQALRLPKPIATTTGLREVKCEAPKNAYPPNPNRALPVHIVNLDLPAADRWTSIVAPLTVQMNALINEVFDKLPANLTKYILEHVDKDAAHVLSRFPADYGEEILGIAAATGINLGYVLIYNIFYEISSLCTSIVAQDDNGNVYHARNLDFGLFMGWDNQTHDWAVASLLRPLLFVAQFQKDGVTIYNSTQYAGYVGILTGFKKGAFSITVDSRLDSTVDVHLVEWFEGTYNGVFVGFQNRQLLENTTTYADALNTITTTNSIAPVYLILGGTAAGEGAVVTREPTEAINIWTLQSELNNGSFFLLETNYAHWKPAPFFDDRSGPGILCMEQLGQANVGFPGLFNVLSGKPNLNMLTTYTALMHVATGESQSFLQECELPCPLW